MTDPPNTILDFAYAAVGATAGDGRYEDIVSAGECPENVHDMNYASGCGLVIRGLIRQWLQAQGVTPPPGFVPPYKFGAVMTTLLAISYRAGAVDIATAEPYAGDIVWLDGPEHVEIYYGDDWRIAGGQRDSNSRETILCVSRGHGTAEPPATPYRVLMPRRCLRIVRWAKLGPYLAEGGQ